MKVRRPCPSAVTVFVWPSPLRTVHRDPAGYSPGVVAVTVPPPRITKPLEVTLLSVVNAGRLRSATLTDQPQAAKLSAVLR